MHKADQATVGRHGKINTFKRYPIMSMLHSHSLQILPCNDVDH